MAVKTKKCEWCGEIFLTYSGRAKYCCEECKRAPYRGVYTKKGQKEEPVVMSSLAETNQAAREAGMSYGKYVGMLWLEEQRAKGTL